MELTPKMQEALERASRIVAESKHLVALGGAGMSAESGIPTYRGPGGLWTRIGEPDPRRFQNFAADPKGWWERTLERDREAPESPDQAQFRNSMQNAKPNAGHYALVDLERMGKLQWVITQNVDNLHRAAGTKNITEIHGNRHLLRCMGCNHRIPREEFEIDPHYLPPRCPQCGGVIKGDGVMFGEPIPPDSLAMCVKQANRCDAMLVLGTSGTVYPAAGFPLHAMRRGAQVIEVNPYPTPISEMVDMALRGPTGELLPLVVSRVRELLDQRSGSNS
ncbi:MAG: NAD-dependent deacylase [Chloroflexi bacterium]|nr:NAD-dependent deacylase [Chloroflexota bacterium]